MQIEVAVLLDGKNIKLNDDLQDLLQNLVVSYIKSTLGLGKVKKEKKVKDPNAPKKTRTLKPWTLEEELSLLTKLKEGISAGDSINNTARKLAPEFGRTASSLTNKILEFKAANQL